MTYKVMYYPPPPIPLVWLKKLFIERASHINVSREHVFLEIIICDMCIDKLIKVSIIK